MTEQTETYSEATDPHKVPSVFVSELRGIGQLNNVMNLTFVTSQFTPKPDGTIDPDFIVTARLRMDLVCAQQLRDELSRFLEQLTVKPDGESAH